MFESKPISAGHLPLGEGRALKAIAWPELTARINAARDLRSVLRREGPQMMASFTDAAAGYFGTGEQSKRAVNPDALERGKPVQGIDATAKGEALIGDREK